MVSLANDMQQQLMALHVQLMMEAAFCADQA